MKVLPLFVSTAVLAACAQIPVGERTMRLNDIQVIGSHNSYRRMPTPVALARLEAARPGFGTALAYDHPSLADQLSLGVRQVELDIFADPDGGRFATPGETFPEMQQPGFKVLHLPVLDAAAHCRTLAACLADLMAWSDDHPGHLPITITIDAKDVPFGIPGVGDPLALDAGLLDTLDREILTAIPAGRLIRPDEVRGGARTLREAVRSGGWPSLERSRGRFMVIFDVRPATADLYRRRHPSLRGRAMFSVYPDNQPEAAVAIIQDPRGQVAQIRRLVGSGLIVRTRSDANTREARTADRSALEAAVESGAQMISTDYYPGAPDPLGLGFVVDLPGDVLARCNPVTRPPECHLPQPY
jgi:hypothetical protein